MSTFLPSLKFFPIYTGGAIVDGKNGLNGNSSFTIPATKFNKAYSVNMPSAGGTFDPNTFISLGTDKNHRLVSQPISAASNYTTPLGINNSVPGHIGKVSVPATAPEIPNLFKQAAALYAISDTNFTDLMAQPSFRIPTVGMGLKVTTDGNGGVQGVSLDPSSLGTMRRANAVGHDLGGPNRAAISIAATYKVNDPGFSFGDVYAVEAPNGPKKTPPTKNVGLDPLAALNQGGLNKTAGIFSTGVQSDTALAGLGAIGGPDIANSIQARLNQLQPQDTGLSLSGTDAGLDVIQAQQVAANQADYGVNLSSNFYQDMASVASAAKNQQLNSYAATYAPTIDHTMDGRVNLQPWQMPSPVSQGTASVGSTVSFDMGASVGDATAGKSKNGYMPFNMQSDTSSSSSGGGFSNPNPFASGGGGMQGGLQGGMSSGGGSPSNQRTPLFRKPLAYSA
jgi:hypothetical protein